MTTQKNLTKYVFNFNVNLHNVNMRYLNTMYLFSRLCIQSNLTIQSEASCCWASPVN